MIFLFLVLLGFFLSAKGRTCPLVHRVVVILGRSVPTDTAVVLRVDVHVHGLLMNLMLVLVVLLVN